MKTKNVSSRERLSDEERRKLESKDVFTTGEAARICHVAPRMVSRWVDEGRLKGYRVPNSKDRRIPRANLARFIETHGIEFKLSDPAESRVLCIGFTPELFRQVSNDAIGNVKFAEASSGFTAGALLAEFRPTHVVVDLAMGRIDAMVIATGCISHLPNVEVLGYSRERVGPDDYRGFGQVTSSAAELLRAVMAKKGGV